MLDALTRKRQELADDHFSAYDFSPYQVEQASGWSWSDGAGEVAFTRPVFLIPPRADGSPGDVDLDASLNATLKVVFAHNSTNIIHVYATLNGDDVGQAAPITTNDPRVTPAVALRAILARIEGRFDEPALTVFGPLAENSLDDIAEFARQGLAAAEAA